MRGIDCATIKMSSNSLLSSKKVIRRKKTATSNTNERFNADFLMPNYEEELALNPKKLEQLKQWLCSKMSVNRGNKTLLLTGPSGSGKKTAVKIICAELGIEVTEWDCEDEYSLDHFGEKIIRQSSLNSFVKFIQDTEFCSIQRMSLKHRLLLIGQLPSPLLREPKDLHEILADVIPHSRCIVAFVLPNVDSHWELSPIRLFPPTVVDNLGIFHVKFNPISATLMTRAIRRTCKILSIHNLGTEGVEGIVNSSYGNIWRAMNSLLFLKNEKLQKIPLVKRARLEKQGQMPTTSKAQKQESMPEQLELFHFVGKVMYAKRAEKSDHKWSKTEAKLHPLAWRKYARPLPPKDDLNLLIDKAPISAQMLTSYLFENEPRFAPSIRAVRKIVSALADLDIMAESNFEHQMTMEKYSLELAVRSSLLYNYCSDAKNAPKRRFYQFEKPRYREVDLQRKETTFRISGLFPLERSSEMVLLQIPTLARIQPICSSRSQFELLKQITFSSQHKLQLRPSRILPLHQQSVADSEMVSEMALAILDEDALSPNASRDSYYSISSNHTEQQEYDDGYNYDIEE